jgi:ABC-2 type transport system ATP-binding protein
LTSSAIPHIDKKGIHPMQTLAIQLEAVSKRIKERTILEDVFLEVPHGVIFGIRGPNGTGKSMLLRIICGLVFPTFGTVRVLGQTIGRDREFPENTGALIDTPGFLPHHSGRKNLELLAMIRNHIGPDDIRDAILRVGMEPDDRRPVRQYSTGMRQRLGLAQAIMEHPRLLILDEPTRGVDEEGTSSLHQLLIDLRDRGVTILLTSHHEDETRELCDKVFLIEHCRLKPDFVSTNTKT